jgi:pyruvate/2-oxoglutarate dehydrogenase complex dihydrolipoamide acyltransferase (E2) component
MARDGDSGGRGDNGGGSRDDNRGDDNQKEARARRDKRRADAAAAKAAAEAAAAEKATPAATPAAPAEVVAPITAAKAKPKLPGAIGTSLVGAINRSSGDTGRSNLNPAAVARAKTRGTAIGQIVSSIDGSRARSKIGGIAKKAGASGSSKIVDTSGL